MHVLTGDWTLKIKCREKCNSGELSKENTVGGHRYNGQPEWPNRLVTGQEQLKRVLYENAELTNCFRDWDRHHRSCIFRLLRNVSAFVGDVGVALDLSNTSRDCPITDSMGPTTTYVSLIQKRKIYIDTTSQFGAFSFVKVDLSRV